MDVAIRSGIPFKLNEPTMDDRFKNSNTRKYTFRQDGVTLDGESRKDFLSAITTYEKLEARRKDEEAMKNQRGIHPGRQLQQLLPR